MYSFEIYSTSMYYLPFVRGATAAAVPFSISVKLKLRSEACTVIRLVEQDFEIDT